MEEIRAGNFVKGIAIQSEISNKGIELLIRGTVYEKGDFSADYQNQIIFDKL